MIDLPQNTPQVRLKFINYDARREPKTPRWCICCQRDLKPNETARFVYVTGGYQAVHPSDLKNRPPQLSDFGLKLMGFSRAPAGSRMDDQEQTRSERPEENAACVYLAARVCRASAPGRSPPLPRRSRSGPG